MRPRSHPSTSPRETRASALASSAALFATVALVSACGGGSSDNAAPAPAPAPAPATVSQTVKVIDGAIRGATVCLDKNANLLCDSGEPSAVTAADGSATLTIAAADANQHRVIALVGTDAVDAEHGAVPVAFTLQAPADRPAVISPLSTMVVAQAAAANQSTADAEKSVQEALGLTASPLADFTASASSANVSAGAAARLLVLATQQQTTALASAKDSAGIALAKADVAKAIEQNLLTLLPTVATALAPRPWPRPPRRRRAPRR